MLKRSLPLLIGLTVVSISCNKSTGPDTNEIIKQPEVEEIVSSLSDNSMRGRGSFSPGIEKAADYITTRFEKIGLEPVAGNQNYRQQFTLYELSHSSSALHLNGQTMNLESYFTYSYQQEISWPDLSSLRTSTIPAPEDFRQQFLNATAVSEDMVVLVDPAHEDEFNSYISVMRTSSPTLNPDQGTSKLFILTSETSVNSGDFTYSATIEEQKADNLIGKIPGSSSENEKVIFSAHYDHLGITPEAVNGDSIANGADDNASGTAAIIMLAKYFKELSPNRTLLFVGFAAEEIGLFGSRYFAQQIDPGSVKTMINIDMIGKISKFGANTAYLTGFDRSNLGDILQSNLRDTKYMIHPDPYRDQNLFFRSDNAPVAQRGVPAHTVSTVKIDSDQYYHTVDDEVNTLDFKNLTNVIRAIAIGSQSIVNGNETPSRVEMEQLSE